MVMILWGHNTMVMILRRGHHNTTFIIFMVLWRDDPSLHNIMRMILKMVEMNN